MKISEMTNDQATEAMIKISSALSSICANKEVESFLTDISKNGDEDVLTAIPKFLPRFTTLAFKTHKDSVYEIISALSGCSKQAVGKMNFKETISIVGESWEDIRTFFPSSVSKTQTVES